MLQEQHLACQYNDRIAFITIQLNSCSNVILQKIYTNKKKLKMPKHTSLNLRAPCQTH